MLGWLDYYEAVRAIAVDLRVRAPPSPLSVSSLRVTVQLDDPCVTSAPPRIRALITIVSSSAFPGRVNAETSSTSSSKRKRQRSMRWIALSTRAPPP